MSEHFPAAGGARAPQWRCKQGWRQRWLIDGKDEDGEVQRRVFMHLYRETRLVDQFKEDRAEPDLTELESNSTTNWR
jgi:hypothetical protein